MLSHIPPPGEGIPTRGITLISRLMRVFLKGLTKGFLSETLPPVMKLFIYDHCPYCVKARMIFGLKGLSCEMVTLANDDEKTPVSMIGRKMLPILEDPPGQYRPESLDIIKYVDQKTPPPVVQAVEDSKLLGMMNQVKHSLYSLAMPRWQVCGMAEFQTLSAQKYFQNRKEHTTGPFHEALKNSPRFKQSIHHSLSLMENMLSESGPWYLGESLSLNDFHLFAFLRTVSVVRDFKLPPRLHRYRSYCSKKSGVPLGPSVP